jgi:hypothetical protein
MAFYIHSEMSHTVTQIYLCIIFCYSLEFFGLVPIYILILMSLERNVYAALFYVVSV